VDLEQRLRQGPLRVRTAWSAEQSARLPRQVVRLRRRRSLMRASFAAGALVCVAAALFARASLRDTQSAKVTASTHVSAAPVLAASTPANTAPEAITLHDGSRAEPIDRESRVAVISDRPGQVKLQLQRGGARFDVVHDPERVFEVQAGAVLVRVAGTIFDVTRSADGAQTTVAVERGRVHVTWSGQTTDVVAGESRIFPPPLPAQASKAESAEPQAAHKSETIGWRDLARRGEYRQAYSALHGARTHVQDAPEDLMLAADVARLSGHPEQAVQHLRAVSDRFPNDPRAPVAAFTLGGVLLHELEQPRAAADAFHRARTLWSQGPLALDAWASEAEALHSAGDLHGAAQLAARYLAAHPDGRHARSMRTLASAE
jgi:transmembrane sensor